MASRLLLPPRVRSRRGVPRGYPLTLPKVVIISNLFQSLAARCEGLEGGNARNSMTINAFRATDMKLVLARKTECWRATHHPLVERLVSQLQRWQAAHSLLLRSVYWSRRSCSFVRMLWKRRDEILPIWHWCSQNSRPELSRRSILHCEICKTPFPNIRWRRPKRSAP